MAELIVRPDADPEVSSLDGRMETYLLAGETWANLLAGQNFATNDSDTSARIEIKSDAANDKWENIYRGILSFPRGILPKAFEITSATLSLRGLAKNDDLGITPDINIYAFTEELEDNDTWIDNTQAMWDGFGTTPFSTAITYAGWDITGWNDFDINLDGRLWIPKTGNIRFGIRNANYDATGNPPVWAASEESNLYWYTADFGDGSYAPKLTIVYYSGQDSVDSTVIGNKVSLEAIRNLEFVYGGRYYHSKEGLAVYESIYHRNT